MKASGLKLLVVGETAGADSLAERIESLRRLEDSVMFCASVESALAALRSDARNSFNINTIIVSETTEGDPHSLLEYAPNAARVLVTDEPSPKHESFGINISPTTLSQSESLSWLRAGLDATRTSRSPSARLLLHLPSRTVLSANEACLRLIRARGFAGGPLTEILSLPEPPFEQESWRGTVEAADGAILGVTTRRLTSAWLFVALSDITDVEADRAANRREENLMLLGRAAAVLAHEIGNPLAAIKANLQLVAGQGQRPETSAVAQYLDRSLTEVSRLSGIVNNYLSLVREPKPAIEPLHRLVTSAFEQVGDMFASVKVRCEVSLIPEHIRVQFGASHFHQIAWNVARNAADSMLRASTSDPLFRVHVISLGDDTVELGFDDNGEGLPLGSSDRLFDAFVTTKGSGTGLGLMVCRLLARQFGGDIEMVRLEAGARALLTLRLAAT